MVYLRCTCYAWRDAIYWNPQLSYASILETYSLEEILELNDLTEEETLDFLVTQGFLELPEIKPLDFE